MRIALGVVAAVISGCSLNADFTGTTFACDPGNACPGGFTCVADRCEPDGPPPSTCATAIGAGVNYACAIRSDGTAWCWGQNTAGQLGDNTTVDRTAPVAVVSTEMPKLTSITTGFHHTCAIGVDHSVWCWGGNGDGQLGNNTTSDNHTPVKVTGIASASALALGGRHTCALDGGAVKCWGNNDLGQLGNGSTGSSSIPVAAQVAGGVTAIAAGNDETCAVDGAGGVSCWGANDSGQLGDGMAPDAERMTSTPVAMALPGEVATQVAVGADFACAVAQSGAVYCTGHNDHGQVGPPTLPSQPACPVNNTDCSITPRRIPLDVKATAVIAGNAFACAIDDQHALWCWGADDNLALADGGDGEDRTFPVQLHYPDAEQVSAGGGYLCVRSSDGLRCSGYNGFGQLGIGVRTTMPAPIAVDAGQPVTSVASGAAFTCAVLADETAACWGNDQVGQLGDGTFGGRTHPVPVVGLAHVKKLASNQDHTCALVGDTGGVACWGDNASGELGDGSRETRSTAQPVLDGAAALTGAVDLAVGSNHSCALLANGKVKCWGANNLGQLGSGTAMAHPDQLSATEIVLATTPTAGPTGVTQIVAGDQFTCALDGDGAPWCWGDNGVDKLGTGNSDPSFTLTPMKVAMPDDVKVAALSTFAGFACARAKVTNDVWCWGFNGDGELALGTFDFVHGTPGKAAGVTATALSVGQQAACVILGDGSVSCWGADYLGQVGAAEYDAYPAPQPVSGLTGATQISAGGQHTCALVDGGKLVCWGDDRDGELGNGVTFTREPVAPLLACPK